MLFVLAAFVTAAIYTIQSQSAEVPKPLVQLTEDLRSAVAHASLNDEQKVRLQADSTVLQAAREAREQGRAVDRKQVAGAVRDIRSVADSGAFSQQDQHALRADIEALRKQQSTR